MRLDPDNRKLFFVLYFHILAYSNRHTQAVPGEIEPEDIADLMPLDLHPIRDALYDRPELIAAFVEENLFGLAPDVLAIVSQWRHFIRGTFYVLRQLSQHAIFLPFEDSTRAFGVLALNDTFETLVRQPLPALLDTVLLPFRGCIISDGLMKLRSVTLGGGIRRDLNDLYDTAKARYGVITSLPFTAETREPSDAELLLFYLKNEGNRGRYWRDIHDLIAGSHELRVLYHQEMGKIEARWWKKRMKELTIGRSWFACYEGMIFGSGGTREEAEGYARRVVPADKHDFIHLFEHKPK